MLWRGGLILICALGFRAHAAIGVCDFYRNAYQSEIRPKIQAGVPFELMSVVVSDGIVLEKKAIRITYNLWDEIVMVKSGEQTVARFPLAHAPTEVCKYLELDALLEQGRRYTFRILLNPLWGERITRLQVASGELNGNRIVGVNWRKLASEMPSDKVLFEKDIWR